MSPALNYPKGWTEVERHLFITLQKEGVIKEFVSASYTFDQILEVAEATNGEGVTIPVNENLTLFIDENDLDFVHGSREYDETWKCLPCTLYYSGIADYMEFFDYSIKELFNEYCHLIKVIKTPER